MENLFSSTDSSGFSGTLRANKESKRLEALTIAKEKISKGDWEVVLNPKASTSCVWKIFVVARDATTKNFVDFAQCKRRNTVKAYSVGNSTSLMRHYNECS